MSNDDNQPVIADVLNPPTGNAFKKMKLAHIWGDKRKELTPKTYSEDIETHYLWTVFGTNNRAQIALEMNRLIMDGDEELRKKCEEMISNGKLLNWYKLELFHHANRNYLANSKSFFNRFWSFIQKRFFS